MLGLDSRKLHFQEARLPKICADSVPGFFNEFDIRILLQSQWNLGLSQAVF